MIFGRPLVLWTSAFTAVFGALVIALNQIWGITISPELGGAIVIAFGSVGALLANQTPTVKSGSELNVVRPNGEPNTTITVK